MRARLPDDEEQRLQASARYADSMPAEPFERLTRLAAHLFSAPVAMLTLVGTGEVDVKAIYGASMLRYQRVDSFCQHTILSQRACAVLDTLQDPRFEDLPPVRESPFVRFCASAPLRTLDNHALGSLCVLDTAPRNEVTEGLLSDLEDLAGEAVDLLELFRAKQALEAAQAKVIEQQQQMIEVLEQRARSEQHAQLALRAGRMGIWQRDADSDMVRLSAELSVLLGLEAKSHVFTMEEWIASVHEQDRAVVIETIERAGRTQENYLLKYRSAFPGPTRWLTSSGTYYKDAQGRFTGAYGVAWDSTAEDEVIHKLRESEEQFRGLTQAVPVGVFLSSTAGDFTFVNPQMVAIFGRPVEQLLGCRWFGYVHDEDQESFGQNLAGVTGTLPPGEMEFRMLRPDREIRWIHARSAILFDSAHQPRGQIGMMEDVTDRRAAMKQLKMAKEAAEVANSTKDMFLANVSHELRTPLNGVLGMAELLLTTTLDEEQREMAETIVVSGSSLLALVNDVLDVGRIEAGTIRIERLNFRLLSVIEKAISVMDAEAKRKQLVIRTGINTGADGWFLGDPHRIEQILLNYLSNAVKFSDSGEILVQVYGASTDGLTDIRIAVTDNGPGIPPKMQNKLFQRFSQVDTSSTRRTGGVGLGLSISKRLAELMGGSVGIQSLPGQGATFWLHLPLASAAVGAVKTNARDLVPARENGRVLLAEDNPINQRVALKALKKLGWEADIATHGLAALDLFCRNKYALVLMDCHMPQMDGFDATRKIREWEQQASMAQTPVVALTANAMTGDRELCLAAGMNDHLAKPFALEQLNEILERWSVPASTCP